MLCPTWTRSSSSPREALHHTNQTCCCVTTLHTEYQLTAETPYVAESPYVCQISRIRQQNKWTELNPLNTVLYDSTIVWSHSTRIHTTKTPAQSNCIITERYIHGVFSECTVLYKDLLTHEYVISKLHHRLYFVTAAAMSITRFRVLCETKTGLSGCLKLLLIFFFKLRRLTESLCADLIFSYLEPD